MKSGLYQQLVDLRNEIAKKKKLPPYVIFPNVTLEEMTEKLPQTEAELLKLKNVTEKKAKLYGKAFLEVIENFD